MEMTPELRQKIEALCKELHGMPLKWRRKGFNNVTVEAFMLADVEKGISIKPLDAEDITKLGYSEDWVEDPDFYFYCYRTSTEMSTAERLYKRLKNIKAKLEAPMTGEDVAGNDVMPSTANCPFA